jgi:hypothetical protein
VIAHPWYPVTLVLGMVVTRTEQLMFSGTGGGACTGVRAGDSSSGGGTDMRNMCVCLGVDAVASVRKEARRVLCRLLP